MENIAIQRAEDLSPDARRAVEQVLGRALRRGEEVSIMAFPARLAPTGKARQAAARQLKRRINRTAGRVRHVSQQEQDSTIDEAVQHVHSHPK